MGYNLTEPSVFINIKLTDIGRRQLSLGKLTFSKAKLSDKEINYSIDTTGDYYSILNNRILEPSDDYPDFNTMDGLDAVVLGDANVTSAKQISTATTTTAGFFTGSSNSFAIDYSKILGETTITYSNFLPSGGTIIKVDTGGYSANTGDLLFIAWEPIQNSGKTYSSTSMISSGNPTNNCWYRVANSSGEYITVDRPTPCFGTAPTAQKINIYFYPYNGIATYYGSAATVDARVWNMNIVRTNSVEGKSASVSGYTTYGSIEYNGTKQFFGFSAETPVFGVLHYTNEYTGNTYAEQLVEKSVRVDIPNIMWHDIGGDNGQTLGFGVSLYDIAGDRNQDTISNSTYRDLRDGTTTADTIVGRVYHKLKLIIINDSELLTAMTYKSNRSYTLPKLILQSSSVPKYPLSNSQATGLLRNDKTYYVTYIAESNSAYTQNISFGYPKGLHCSYISKIEGQTDSNGNPQFLSARFPTNSFPYLRSSTNMDSSSAYSGTGWNANSVQLLVNEVDSSAGYQEGSVPTTGWKRVSTVKGNGIYTGETTDTTIDPLKLAGYQFIVSREDYLSGTTYVLNDDFIVGTTGLTFGNESFFYGNVSANILATTYKSIMTVYAKNDEYNTSVNPTFDSSINEETYITGIGILDDSDNLVAVGKPTNPIKKTNGRYLAFQLEIDF